MVKFTRFEGDDGCCGDGAQAFNLRYELQRNTIIVSAELNAYIGVALVLPSSHQTVFAALAPLFGTILHFGTEGELFGGCNAVRTEHNRHQTPREVACQSQRDIWLDSALNFLEYNSGWAHCFAMKKF